MPGVVNMIDTAGNTFAVPEEQVGARVQRGWRVEGAQDVAARTTEAAKEELYGGAGGAVAATAAGIARGATLGLSDVAARATGIGDDLGELRERNAGLSTVAEIGGALLTGGTNLPGGLATKLGARIARGAEGAGALAQVGRAAAGAAAEGALFGAGTGVSELALSDDPLTVERVASVMGSNILLGGATGGTVGAVGKGIGLGLRRAKTALDDVAKKGLDVGADVGEDLSQLDTKGLRAAQKKELDAIELARVPERAKVADELAAFRKELKEQKVWLATKGIDDAEVKASAIGKRSLKADRQLDNLLDDPRALAENPRAAMSALRKQEAALDDLVNKHGEKLRAKFATDTSVARMKALDFASTALEKNRSLQARIGELSSKPASARLEAIEDALAGLGRPKQSTLGDVIGDSALGYAVGAAAGVPVLGTVVMAARAGAGIVKKLGTHQAELAARGSQAVQALLGAGGKVAPVAPVLATKVLGAVRYATEEPEARGRKKAARTVAPDLATSFKARANELRSQVAPTAAGGVAMRPEARAQVAERLAPVRAVDPVLADRIETVQARKVEFLASKLPRKPDVMAQQLGPDTWQASDMEMRAFARFMAAVEDPMGVVDRLAAGSVSPEDVEAMKAVYPEMHADIVRQIIEQLPTLQRSLPYQKRLALSIFSGVAVDPAMDPAILAVLQGSFGAEAGSEGGTMAPRAQPAFGSVSKEKATPAQERAAG